MMSISAAACTYVETLASMATDEDVFAGLADDVQAEPQDPSEAVDDAQLTYEEALKVWSD